MRRSHFEALRPVCAVCRGLGFDSPLVLAAVSKEDGGDVLEGILHCSRQGCQREYPIVDGIPLLIADLRGYVTASVGQVLGRVDLSARVESLLGDCLGPGSSFETTRQHLSTYTWSHYGDLDPTEASPPPPGGSAAATLEKGLELAPPVPGPILDAGCSVGRTSLRLVEGHSELVLGLDMNFAMLQVARQALTGRLRYPRRRVGGVYDRREIDVAFDGAERVDFWAADVLALPFGEATFGGVACLNVLDCVASPSDLPAELERVLRPGASAWLASPYDWSASATPMEGWLGGHSQRGAGDGASEPALRALLTPGTHRGSVESLEIVGEADDLPWTLRLHDRSRMRYDVHLVVLRKSSGHS